MTKTQCSTLESIEEELQINLNPVKTSDLELAVVLQDSSALSPNLRQSKRKQRKRRTELDPGDDGYRWHKYGQKTLMDTTFIRGYYRCAQKGTGCQAKKMVDNHASGNATLRITYDGQHNHPMPQLSREIILPNNTAYFSNNSSGLSRHSSGISSITSADLDSDDDPLKQKQGEPFQDLNFSPQLNHPGNSNVVVDKETEHNFIPKILMDEEDNLMTLKRYHSMDSNIVTNKLDYITSLDFGYRPQFGSQTQSSSLNSLPSMYRTSSVNSGFNLKKFNNESLNSLPSVYRTSSVNSRINLEKLSSNEDLQLDLSLSLPY